MHPASRSTRRQLFGNLSSGLFGAALTSLLAQEKVASGATLASASSGEQTLAGRIARAKSVIWLFMIGGASHMESFDPKPLLNQYAGKTIAETPYKQILESPYLANERVVAFDPNNGLSEQRSTRCKSRIVNGAKVVSKSANGSHISGRAPTISV